MKKVYQRSDIIKQLSEKFYELRLADVKISVDVILEGIGEKLSQGRKVEIRNFGSFELNYHAQRNARNPKTGEKVMTTPKYVPHFKAGLGLRNRVDHE